MVQACRYAVAGQVGALLALVAIEILSSGGGLADVGLRFACGCEAIGYGLGALAALQGLARVTPRWHQVVRGGFSLVLWGLFVRHAVLVTDPMAVGDVLVQGSTWGLGALAWIVALGLSARRPGPKQSPVGRQLAWLVAVAAFGAVNTLAMAAVRALI